MRVSDWQNRTCPICDSELERMQKSCRYWICRACFVKAYWTWWHALNRMLGREQ